MDSNSWCSLAKESREITSVPWHPHELVKLVCSRKHMVVLSQEKM
jgi:hypothetical protein